MDKKDFLNSIELIGTCEDDVQRRTMLDELRTNVSAVFDNVDNLAATNKTLQDTNEEIRAANMKLFRQVGQAQESGKGNPGGEDPDKPAKKFEDLFDSNGRLK